MRLHSEKGNELLTRRSLLVTIVTIVGTIVIFRNEQERFRQSLLQSLVTATLKYETIIPLYPLKTDPSASKCAYPIVYNKPHKTGSTTIQMFALRWAQKKGRPAYKCSGFIQKARFQIRECIPHDSSGCAMVATHIELDDITRELLENRIGKFKTITSTRRPDHRILSSFMQTRHLTISRANLDKNGTLADLKRFLIDFNPWKVYNYHTGRFVQGTCPMSPSEEHRLVKLVNRYDIVLDVDLIHQSNTILAAHDLFQLSANSTVNSRGSTMLQLDAEARELLRSKMCVEDELHRLFRFRMASAYEKARGKKCLTDSRHPIPCFQR